MHVRGPSHRIRIRELFDFAGHLANGALDIFSESLSRAGTKPFSNS